MDIWDEMGGAEWVKPFGIQMKATHSLLREKLKNPQTYSNIKAFQQDIATLRNSKETDEEINAIFTSLSEKEENIQAFLKEEEAWEKEGKSQIVFTSEWSRPLNEIPFLLPASAIFKMYIFPFFAVIIPLLSWLIPWVIIRVIYNMNMPFSTYKTMMLDMWFGGQSWESMDSWKQIRVIFQSVWTIFGMYQGVHQPIQQAIHIQSLHKTIVEKGQLIQAFVKDATLLLHKIDKIYKGHSEEYLFLHEVPLWDPIQTFAYIREHPNDLKWIFLKLAEKELVWRIAFCPEVCIPTYAKTLHLEITDFFDPSIPAQQRVKSSVLMKAGKNHSLLTGPNQGGKSSTLRAILLNVWLAQTIGVSFAKSMRLSHFDWIQSGLRLADKPGKTSLFEREIIFSQKTLALSKRSKQYGLVLYDECFHSTNPPDGEKTAQIFLSHLWKSPRTISIISSHVFPLVEGAPSSIEKMCVPAEKVKNGMKYSFKLSPGICKVSSVEEIYKKYGFPLLTARLRNK